MTENKQFVRLENGERAQIVRDESILLKYGVCRVKIPFTPEEIEHWSKTLSQVIPLNMTSEDGEYAFYRNIVDEPDFPFNRLMDSNKSAIAKTLETHFLQDETEVVAANDILCMDDAFCIHYNMSQDDTRCAKHTDPSDVTLNMCFHSTEDIEGSEVLFYNACKLKGVDKEASISTSVNKSNNEDDGHQQDQVLFLVKPEPGYAIVHWGFHPHQTLPLLRGERTNIVVTFVYKDKSRRTATSRTCYAHDCM